MASLCGALLDGKYRVGRELSRGGAGVVYEATHEHLGTAVAVKVLEASAESEGGSLCSLVEPESFLREARLAARLRHPNVVQVLDFGVTRDVPYLVMELVPGESLRARLARGRLSLSETLPILEGIAAALGAAHERGIVHRDLKPENVVVAPGSDGPQVKVVDFGLACAAHLEPGSDGGSLWGTPAYSSPEQASGVGPVTPAVDRWALGVIAFECLTGRRPFEGETLGELVLQLCHWAAPVPSDHAEVPAGFDAWFAKACAREPAERFASVQEQVIALRRCAVAARPGSDAPVAALPPPAKLPRRRRWFAVAAIAALGLGGAALSARSRLSGAPAPAALAAPRSPAALGALRVAVLPLAGAADEAVLRAGLTEALIDGLAARTEHKVIALASVVRLEAAERELGPLLERLGAQRLVVGTLSRVGEQLTLSLEVVAEDQTRLWSASWTRPAHELEQLGERAAAALAVTLGAARPGALAQRQPRDPAAYRAYLHGRYFWAKRDHASLLHAISYFREATAIDPDYARAYVGLADSYLLLPWMGMTPRAEAHEQARAALGRALLLEPDSAEAHASRGNQLLEIDWRFAEAEQAFRRALELDPRNASAHQWLAELLMLSRRFPEAEAEMQLALELEPLNAAVHKNRGKVLYYARRYSEAAAAYSKAIELDPGQPWAYQGLAYAQARLGQLDEALRTVRAEPLWQPPEAAPLLAVQELWLATLRGDAAEQQRALAVIERARLGEVAPWTMAFVYAVLGRRAELCAALEQAYVMRDPFTPLSVLTRELEPYREEPCLRRLVAQLRELGLAP